MGLSMTSRGYGLSHALAGGLSRRLRGRRCLGGASWPTTPPVVPVLYESILEDATSDYSISRISTVDLSVISTTNMSSYAINARGIGGTDAVVWYLAVTGSGNRYSKLSPADFSMIADAAAAGSATPYGAGGDETVFWSSRSTPGTGGKKIDKVNPVDLTLITSYTAPQNTARDTGGAADALWHAGNPTAGTFYKLSPVDATVISSVDKGIGTVGAGGKSNCAWSVNSSTKERFSISPTDLTTIATVSTDGDLPLGIGGQK